MKEAEDGENLICFMGEKECLSLIPEGSVRLHAKTELSLIKKRFAQRMCGMLLLSVE